MNALPTIDIQEVTRLTRAGRLKEAMQLLRGGLTGGSAQAGAGEKARTTSGEAGLSRTGGPSSRKKPTAMIDGVASRPAGGNTARPARGAVDPSPDRPRRDACAPTKNPWAILGNGGLPDFTGLPGMGGSGSSAPVAEGASFETSTYSGSAGSRRYKLYVPASRDTGVAVPLVVMLHGCAQSPDDFAAGTRMNELAEEFGFLVAYPEQSKRANAQKCWNWFETRDQQRDAGEPALIAGITREIIAQHRIDPARVFVAGLSAGGAAAAIMGQRYPELYAAVGVHSGLACGAARDMGSAFSAMRGGAPVAAGERVVPTIVFHGDRDTTVAPVNGDGVIEQAKAGAASNAATTTGTSAGGLAYTRTVHRESDGRERLESWRVHGAGHAWSGGSAAGSYTLPAGPDASREMLRFFLANSR
ncbi:extracellular catalytic domain type 1 short-chain-length polyhydroxyalkanoate depolymerase [Jiella mangrovi]|uniref:PHB depolymerase family esterase n=1 Tax=Jiella mangrovi TaxID=2821407 RepID=A0ABS4BDE3_9HYPH|nr:PHB depolymerase family esterase [Jiella mangrovi]MBP0614000.1 PHB depolymerase family esterase [Jiella mangrovi]